MAAHCGNVKMAKLLLDLKCEVNARALVCTCGSALFHCNISLSWTSVPFSNLDCCIFLTVYDIISRAVSVLICSYSRLLQYGASPEAQKTYDWICHPCIPASRVLHYALQSIRLFIL